MNEENVACFKALRGDIVHFIKDPYQIPDASKREDDPTRRFDESVQYVPDGILLLKRNDDLMTTGQNKSVYVVEGMFPYSDIGNALPDSKLVSNLTIEDRRPGIILPGFIDLHVHATQENIIASYGASLLPWLQEYVLPGEQLNVESTKFAQLMMKNFLQSCLQAGTTTPVAFTTYSKQVPDLLFQEAEKLDMAIITGAQGQDNFDTNDDFVNATIELYEKWHRRGRALYAITLRFAPGSSFQQMQDTERLSKKYPDAYFLTHLAETYNEVQVASLLYQHDGVPQGLPDDHAGVPPNLTYLELYDYFGLLRKNRSVMGHSIHLSESDWELMAERGAIAAHCPTSNNFLGSGLFNVGGAIRKNAYFGMGSDVGGGRYLCTLNTLGGMYDVAALGNTWLTELQPQSIIPEEICVSSYCPSPKDSPYQAVCSEDQPNLTVKEANGNATMCYPMGLKEPQQNRPRPDFGVPPNNLHIHPALAYYSATRGSAIALDLADQIGTFEPGSIADIVVLNPFGSPETSRRTRVIERTSADAMKYLWDRLFVLMIVGGVDNIGATYIAGHPKYVNSKNPLNLEDATTCVLPSDPSFPEDYVRVAECIDQENDRDM